MKTTPLISVVVPVYNVSEYVGRCIKSISGQSYTNIEVIVVDDGSTDDSYSICNKFAKKDRRINLIHQKNKGLSGARNEGLKHVSGEYVCFIDSDDYVKRNFLKELFDAISRTEAEIAVCGFNNIRPRECVMSGRDATIRLLTRQENIDIVAWNKMYKVNLFKDNNIRYPEGSNYEDSLTTYKLLSKANKVVFVDESLYIYEENRTNSITKRAKLEESLYSRKKAADESVQYLLHDASLKQAAEIAVMLSKLAYIDAVIKGKISNKYLSPNEKWVRENFEMYQHNRYFSFKLKCYALMITKCGGVLYRVFRKII